MRFIILLFVLLLPAIGYADTMSGNATTRPSLEMLLFIIGSVTSVLFIRGRQNADYHTGYTPVIQSIIITICFVWAHYILLFVDEQPLWDFYTNLILNINTAFVGLLCVLFLYIGFIAVLLRTIKTGLAKIKKLRS